MKKRKAIPRDELNLETRRLIEKTRRLLIARIDQMMRPYAYARIAILVCRKPSDIKKLLEGDVTDMKLDEISDIAHALGCRVSYKLKAKK